MAALLASSVAQKAFERQRMTAATARIVGSGLPAAALLLLLAACLELLAGLALLVPALRSGGAAAAAAIWLGYGLALARRRGETLDCGCDLVARERPVDRFAIARPLVLAIAGAVVALTPVTAWTLDTPFAASALLALWFAAGEIHSIPKLARIRP